MIVEQRIYTYQPGRVADFLQLYEAQGMAVQLRHLERMVGYYITEIGVLNRTVTMWAYDDLGERERRRSALFADAQWQAFLAQARPLMIEQKTRILRPAPFFRARLETMSQAMRRRT